MSRQARRRVIGVTATILIIAMAITGIYYFDHIVDGREQASPTLRNPKNQKIEPHIDVTQKTASHKTSDNASSTMEDRRSFPISYEKYDDNYRCKVVSPTPDELKSFGLRPEYLQYGWSCLVGDFDWNGYEDYVLIDEGEASADSGPVTVKYIVVFADRHTILKAQLIDDPNTGSLLRYPPRAETGEFGEPVAAHTGLVHWGENSQSYIYLYDLASDSLRRNDFELRIDSLSLAHAEALGHIRSKSERYKHMALLAAMITKHRDDPRVANLYYAMGRLKKGAVYDFPPIGYNIYYHEHKQDYWFYASGDAWNYTGRHFEELLERFPDSEYADDVAYERTLLFEGGHCEVENFIGCRIAGESHSIVEFLHKYPTSPLAKAAVERINKAYHTHLAGIDDLRVRTDDITPEAIERSLKRYQDAAGKLEPYWRAKAYDTIGSVWEKFHNFGRAKELYQYIIENVRHYGNRREIEKRLASLQGFHRTPDR